MGESVLSHPFFRSHGKGKKCGFQNHCKHSLGSGGQFSGNTNYKRRSETHELIKTLIDCSVVLVVIMFICFGNNTFFFFFTSSNKVKKKKEPIMTYLEKVCVYGKEEEGNVSLF